MVMGRMSLMQKKRKIYPIQSSSTRIGDVAGGWLGSGAGSCSSKHFRSFWIAWGDHRVLIGVCNSRTDRITNGSVRPRGLGPRGGGRVGWGVDNRSYTIYHIPGSENVGTCCLGVPEGRDLLLNQ